MKVLVVGSGGRCHAIVDALSKSPQVEKIYCAPGNAGISAQAECIPIKETDVERLRDFASENSIGLTVVGPEASLNAGIVDCFRAAGLRIFGPTKSAARIESSKEFAKRIMTKYGVPTAAYRAFEEFTEAMRYVADNSLPTVIKYDGLAAGKGVTVATTFEEAENALRDMLLDDKFGKGRVIIEEFLEGPEFSLMCFVNGADVTPMPVSQDHKRAFDGDRGPNTGGMGAYTSLPFITDEDLEYAMNYIMRPVAEALVEEGCPFSGVLYGGLMKTRHGIKVIEFNARFGDPETEVVLPRLKSDICHIFCDIADGRDAQAEWEDCATLGIVLASKGYPGSYQKGFPVRGLDKIDGTLYHMGTALKEGEYVTAGGRVMIAVCKAPTLRAAQKKAAAEIAKIECENLFHRTDIGNKAFKIINGKELASSLEKRMAEDIPLFEARYGRRPHLAVILVGENPSSVSYVTSKAKACARIGIHNTTIHKPETITEGELLELIDELNNDDSVDGILVQLPVPKHINPDHITYAIDPSKDVDGFHPINVSRLWFRQAGILPCTPKGIVKMLKHAGVEIAGKNVVVIGRGKMAGLPLSKMLLDENATVTIAHTHTKNLAEVTRRADILVVAIGRPKYISADMVKEGAVVIDVGVNYLPTTGRPCGDVDFDAVSNKVSAISPVPGGVGPMTICCLMENTIECFLNRQCD